MEINWQHKPQQEKTLNVTDYLKGFVNNQTEYKYEYAANIFSCVSSFKAIKTCKYVYYDI